jgi:hypothetical protein
MHAHYSPAFGTDTKMKKPPRLVGGFYKGIGFCKYSTTKMRYFDGAKNPIRQRERAARRKTPLARQTDFIDYQQQLQKNLAVQIFPLSLVYQINRLIDKNFHMASNR